MALAERARFGGSGAAVAVNNNGRTEAVSKSSLHDIFSEAEPGECFGGPPSAPALSRPPPLRYGATRPSRVEAEGGDGRWERENLRPVLEIA